MAAYIKQRLAKLDEVSAAQKKPIIALLSKVEALGCPPLSPILSPIGEQIDVSFESVLLLVLSVGVATVAFVVMVILWLMGMLMGMLVGIVQAGMLYKSIKALDEGSNTVTVYLMYWCVTNGLLLVEATALGPILKTIPFYSLAARVGVMIVGIPETGVALKLFEKITGKAAWTSLTMRAGALKTYRVDPPSFATLDASATCMICLVDVEVSEGIPVIPEGSTRARSLFVDEGEDKAQPKSLVSSDLGSGTKEPQPPSKYRFPQTSGGGGDYFLQLDCSHACHIECLKRQVQVGLKKHPSDKFTFGFLKCPACRTDLMISDPRQCYAKEALDTMLRDPLEKRKHVRAACERHAREDPVDKIKGLDDMSATEALETIERSIGAYQCSKCPSIFCEGTVCGAAAGENDDGGGAREKEALVCPTCAPRKPVLGPVDYSKCPEPLYKCDLCCSVAKYRCPDYYQCEMHHAQYPNKVVHKCPGPEKCSLGVAHPQNDYKRLGFVIGCGCGNCV